MVWHERPIPVDGLRKPMWEGSIELHNDKKEVLAHIMWFYDVGPFFAHAVDLTEPFVIRRIGPCSTLDGAKAACLAVIEGQLDVSKRAGYQR